jgi:hypothetical protein
MFTQHRKTSGNSRTKNEYRNHFKIRQLLVSYKRRKERNRKTNSKINRLGFKYTSAFIDFTVNSDIEDAIRMGGQTYKLL